MTAPDPKYAVQRPDVGRPTDKRVTPAFLSTRPELRGLAPFVPGSDIDLPDEINRVVGNLRADIAASAGTPSWAQSSTTASPRSPTAQELETLSAPLYGLKLTADGGTQKLLWTPHTLAGAWVTVGEPSVTAAQLGTVQTTATAAQTTAAATQTALTRTGIAQLAALPITATPPLVDGSRWVGQVGGTPDALGTVVAAAGGNTWRREGVNGRYQAGWILNPLSTPASRTTALQQAVAGLTAGETFILPTDGREFAPLTLRPANDTRLEFNGVLNINPGSDAALTIAPANPDSTDYSLNTLHRVQVLGGIRVNNLGTARGAGTIGVRIINVMESDRINIAEVSNFERAVLVYGQGVSGSSYNRIYLGRLVDNRITVMCDQTTSGWSTENAFHGGRLAWTDSVYPNDTWAHVRTTPTVAPGANDNNRWISSSFESFRLGGFAADLEGNYNAIIGRCRTEFSGYNGTTPLFRIRDGAYACRIEAGFDVYLGNILDFGAGSQLHARDGQFQGGGNRSRGVYEAGAVFDGADIMFRARNTAGTQTFAVLGDGRISAVGRASVGSVGLPDGPLILSTPANTPNGVVVAPQGSLCLATGGTGATLWIKESGSGNTGWVAK